MALVDDHDVETLWRKPGIVDDGQRLPALPCPFPGMFFFCAFREFFALQYGVHALDRGDDDLAVAGDMGRGEPLDVVEFRELAVVVIGDEGHELLFGLLAQVSGIDEKQDATCGGVLQ